MRLEEWQKWLDTQFLDTSEDEAEKETGKGAKAAPAAQQPAPAAAAPAPPAAPPQPAPGPRVQGAPLAAVQARRPAPPADELDVPSIESYLPFLRAAKQTEPEPAPAADTVPEPEQSAAEPAEEVAPAAEPEPAVPAPAVEAAPDAPARVAETALAGRVEAVAPAEPPTVEPEPEFVQAEEAPRRYGVSHRRARHVRNVRPDEVFPEMDASTLWGLVPRHIQALMAMGDEEVASASYKREFRETRVELIRRLLDPTLSLEDTARLLNVCPTTVRRYTNRGLLAHQRTPGDQRRFKLSDVLAFLEAQSQARK